MPQAPNVGIWPAELDLEPGRIRRVFGPGSVPIQSREGAWETANAVFLAARQKAELFGAAEAIRLQRYGGSAERCHADPLWRALTVQWMQAAADGAVGLAAVADVYEAQRLPLSDVATWARDAGLGFETLVDPVTRAPLLDPPPGAYGYDVLRGFAWSEIDAGIDLANAWIASGLAARVQEGDAMAPAAPIQRGRAGVLPAVPVLVWFVVGTILAVGVLYLGSEVADLLATNAKIRQERLQCADEHTAAYIRTGDVREQEAALRCHEQYIAATWGGPVLALGVGLGLVGLAMWKRRKQ